MEEIKEKQILMDLGLISEKIRSNESVRDFKKQEFIQMLQRQYFMQQAEMHFQTVKMQILLQYSLYLLR